MNNTGNNIKNNQCYLTDEELEKLIAMTEAEPMLQPPKGFQDEVIGRVRQRRQQRKNWQLFSYSMKVFAATAAMLCILLIVPENIDSRDRSESWSMQKEQSEPEPLTSKAEDAYTENLARQINRQMDEYCSRLNEGLNRLVRMEVHFNEKEEK